ncbi:MAG: fumarylacetoacetate hydrolase [Acidimicrobiia bacterium]
MRFVNANGRAAIVVEGSVYLLSEISGGEIADHPQKALEQSWERIVEVADEGSYDSGKVLESVKLGPPVPSPKAIFGIGLNYKDHAAEAGMEVPQVPPVFTKFPTSICGPFDELIIPSRESKVDYEAELVFVISRPAKNVMASEALEYIAGFMCGQDFSERTLQMTAGRQFSIGKSFDTFFPMGPYLVSTDEVGDPAGLNVRCLVNGEVCQSGNTKDMVFGVAELVEFLSSVVTLRPGDVCLTGTPAGVGFVKNPPRFLAPGDVVETEIERIGRMKNFVVAGY